MYKVEINLTNPPLYFAVHNAKYLNSQVSNSHDSVAMNYRA